LDKIRAIKAAKFEKSEAGREIAIFKETEQRFKFQDSYIKKVAKTMPDIPELEVIKEKDEKKEKDTAKKKKEEDDEEEEDSDEDDEKKISGCIIMLSDYIKNVDMYNLESIYLNNCKLVDRDAVKIFDTVMSSSN